MNKYLLTLWTISAVYGAPANAQVNLLTSTSRWTITGDDSEFIEESGDMVLKLRGGATLAGFDFGDGTISFDVRLNSRAGFVGIQFRSDPQNAEHVYFRPHRSGEWDAVQYQPIMNGSSTWQLYRGEGYTAPVDLPHDEWIPIQLRVQGVSAELYVGRTTSPTMRISLERGQTIGGIGLTSGFRGEAPRGEVPGSFRNLRVSSNSRLSATRPTARTTSGGSFIRDWRVSEPYAVSSLPVTYLPDSITISRSVSAEPRGIVNLNRYFTRTTGENASAIVARKQITARGSVVVPIEVDFSDHLSLFLNGELLFSGSNTWQSRYPYYLGTLHPEAILNTVWLHLRPGRNELTLVISESAFGWGFIARTGEVPGVVWQ